MHTQKLYDNDAVQTTFTATVISCMRRRDDYAVILDRTCFFPEGGGQWADHGTLNGIPVTDVQIVEDEILHYCEAPVEKGTEVTGVIDWSRRFDQMQQHSGEHIISGILCSRHHCHNVGFHIGADTITIDYDAPITEAETAVAEQLANEVIWADTPVEAWVPRPKELAELDYRSKKELDGPVRIVRIGTADCCACCGTHVKSAGQVGLIKVLSQQKFRDGVRIEILSGKRALERLSTDYMQNRAVAQALSVKTGATAAGVERLQNELAESKAQLSAAKKQQLTAVAEQYRDAGDVLLFRPPMETTVVRKLADAVAQTCGGRCSVFSGADHQYAYALVRADGSDIREFVNQLNTTLQGRGGGRSGFAQGAVTASEAEIREFYESKKPKKGEFVLHNWRNIGE